MAWYGDKDSNRVFKTHYTTSNLTLSLFPSFLLKIQRRLSTIKGADKIAVVNAGVIAELGNHEALIAKNGLYADLVRLQMTGQVSSSDGRRAGLGPGFFVLGQADFR